MASKAQTGNNLTLEIGGTTPANGIPGPDTYTLIGDVMEAPLMWGEWAMAPTTNFQSTTKESIPTIREEGSVEVKGNCVDNDAGQVLAYAAFKSATPTDFRVKKPANVKAGQSVGSSYVFSAYVKSFKLPDVKPDSPITFSMSLQLIGTELFTPGS